MRLKMSIQFLTENKQIFLKYLKVKESPIPTLKFLPEMFFYISCMNVKNKNMKYLKLPPETFK